MNSEQRLKIKNYVLEYLGTRAKLPAYVLQALVQLYARLTKIGWNDVQKDNNSFRAVTEDMSNFLQVGYAFENPGPRPYMSSYVLGHNSYRSSANVSPILYIYV